MIPTNKAKKQKSCQQKHFELFSFSCRKRDHLRERICDYFDGGEAFGVGMHSEREPRWQQRAVAAAALPVDAEVPEGRGGGGDDGGG